MSILAGVELVGGAAIGIAVGTAAGDVVIPRLQEFLNEQWQAHPDKPLSATAVAEAVAEAIWTLGEGQAEGARSGLDGDRLGALVELARKAPGLPQLLALRRRELINDGNVNHGLQKARLEPMWHGPLADLKDERLDPAVVATAVQRGILANDGILPVGPPTEVGTVPPMPMVAIDPVVEARDSGWTRERLEVQARITGLPPGPGQLLDLLNRGAIEQADFYRGVAEGNIRNEWGPALEQLRHELISPAEAAGLRLRGWITPAESYTLGAKQGADPQVMDYLYLNRGRPIAPVQAYTAHFRDSPGPVGLGYTRGPHAFDEEDFLRALRQSDVRTEYGPTLWANRYAYPPLFQLRRAVESGGISPARARVIMRYERYEDQDAAALLASWVQAGAATGKSETKAELAAEFEGLYITEAEYRAALTALGYTGPTLDLEVHLGDARRVKKYRDAIVTELHGEYIAHDVDDADVQATLAEIAVNPEAVAHLLALWQIERRVHRRQLTAAQVKRGYKRGHITLAAAEGRLADLGYDATETEVLLD